MSEFNFKHSEYQILAMMQAKGCSRIVAIEYLDRLHKGKCITSLVLTDHKQYHEATR